MFGGRNNSRHAPTVYTTVYTDARFRDMSTRTRENLEEVIIAGLLEEAAVAIRRTEQSDPRRRRHDQRIFKERAEAALQAVAHLEGALS